jgi:simple sugar transport system permease protein
MLPGMGYDSIAVALLGNSSPVVAIFASMIVTVFQSGANYMSSSVGVAKEIASLITGILLLFAACGEYMKALGARKIQRDEDARAALREASSCGLRGPEDAAAADSEAASAGTEAHSGKGGTNR